MQSGNLIVFFYDIFIVSIYGILHTYPRRNTCSTKWVHYITTLWRIYILWHRNFLLNGLATICGQWAAQKTHVVYMHHVVLFHNFTTNWKKSKGPICLV